MLLLLAFSLDLDAGIGGPMGDYVFWLPAVACAYALLLPMRLGGLLLVLSLTEFVTTWWLASPTRTIPQFSMEAGLMLIFGLTALLFGRSLLRSESEMESTLIDSQSNLYNKAGLFVHGTQLLKDCLRDDRALSMVLINCRDLADVRKLLGRDTATRMFGAAVRAVAQAAPRAGLAARTDKFEFVLLLPGLTNAQAKKLVHASLGEPPMLMLQTGTQVVMNVTIGSLGQGIANMEQLYELLQTKLKIRHAPLASQEDKGSLDSILEESGGPLSRLELSPTLPMPMTP